MTASPRGSDFADDTVVAIRWLRRSYRAGALVDAVAAVWMGFPSLYGPMLRFRRGFRRSRSEFVYGTRTGAPLMAGWTVLLLWADRDPLARRGVLAITIAPVLVGLIAKDANAVHAGELSGRSVAPVRHLQLALVALFIYSLAKARVAARAGD